MNNYNFNGLFFGTISEVFPPDSDQNSNKAQYEYEVILTGNLYSQMYVRCIAMDLLGGGLLHSDDIILDRGYRVFVMFPRGDSQLGIIIGGSRQRNDPQENEGDGPRRRIRLNEVQEDISSEGEYSVAIKPSENGPAEAELKISNKEIVLDAHPSLGDTSITLNRDTPSITIKTKDLSMELTGNKTINITGDASIKVGGSVDITAAGDATIKAKKLSAEFVQEAEIKAAQKVSVQALEVNLAGKEGQVITTATQPTCYVTGIPFKGSIKVKAGL